MKNLKLNTTMLQRRTQNKMIDIELGEPRELSPEIKVSRNMKRLMSNFTENRNPLDMNNFVKMVNDQNISYLINRNQKYKRTNIIAQKSHKFPKNSKRAKLLK
uniref:Uncharacterized protein n=1 Tax=Euplotes crassus TaxID=5936 RepID=A0A7S3KEL3_EUPCR|mmetsp:Transcript_19175/g.18823  ORF Transcript_19175/g.18823 Transcript_19175/m.18823 type:complete len:103 (+) Transcript_19175:247-555(+)